MKIRLNLARIKEVRPFMHTGRVTEYTKICARMKGVYVDINRGCFVATNDEVLCIRKNILRYDGDNVMRSPVDGFVLTKNVLAQLSKQKMLKKDVEVEVARGDAGKVKLTFNGIFETVVPGKYGFVNWELALSVEDGAVRMTDLPRIMKEAKESMGNYKILKELALKDKNTRGARYELSALKNPAVIRFYKSEVCLLNPFNNTEGAIQKWTLGKETNLNNVDLSIKHADMLFSTVGEDAEVFVNKQKCFEFHSTDKNKIIISAAQN